MVMLQLMTTIFLCCCDSRGTYLLNNGNARHVWQRLPKRLGMERTCLTK